MDGSQTSDPAASDFAVSADGRTLTWTYDFELDGDPAAVITYQVTIDDDAAAGDQTNVAEFCIVLASSESACDTDDETVTVPELTIAKSVDGYTGGTAEGGTPVANVDDTLTYTLDYTLVNGPVNNGVITDVVPAGLEYVDGSATDSDEFSFQGATADADGTTSLEWTAAQVSESGSVSYDVTVLESAARDTDLVNVATIDSDETPPDDDDKTVTVPESPVPGLTIAKSNDAPVETIDLGDGLTVDLPTLEEGDSATFTLVYALVNGPGGQRRRDRRPARRPGVRRRHRQQQRRVQLRRLRRGDPDAALGGHHGHREQARSPTRPRPRTAPPTSPSRW